MYHVWVGRSAGETRQGAVVPGEWCMAWMVRCACWEVVRHQSMAHWAALDHVDGISSSF